MIPALKKLLFIFILVVTTVSLRAANEALGKRYDESIFVISNFSGVDAIYSEPRTIKELLEEGIDGFRFHIEWEKIHNKLVLKESNNNSSSFIEVLKQLKQHLDSHPDKILTILLDFNVNVNEVSDVFEKSGLMEYVYHYDKQEGWLSLRKMKENQKRLVVFSMQEHRYNPDWIHYIWDYAVEPYLSLLDSPDFIGEFLKGDPNNDLLIYNESSLQEPKSTYKYNGFRIDQNPYLIEHFRNIWDRTGKTPNFIMLDRFISGFKNVADYMANIKVVKGTVTYNMQPLDYVSWEGRNSLTSGRFSFPIWPGDNITLTPRSPGYRFKPESVPFGELTESKEQHFIAFPLEIDENLEAYYPFDNNVHDRSRHGLNGNPVGVTFKKDTIRSAVAYFDNKDHIVLSRAEEFKVRDHDFTVAAWVKIADFLPDKTDYCILGTPTNSYQEGIHLVIRNRKPYFGFFSNDLEGNMIFEAGKWYHIVWRYTKLNGEQAIYVNGRLDSRSLGHPSYKGREKLIIGLAGFSIQSNMYGYIDNLAIWSRALGNEEIWGLSKDIIEPLPEEGIFLKYRYWFFAFTLALVTGVVILLRRKKNRVEIFPAFVKKEEKISRTSQRNCINLFGDFQIIDKSGEDITPLFTPKLKQLFLVILVYSLGNKKGISTKELTDIVWPNHSYQNAKNSRGVTIRKLRLILEAMDKIEIVFHVDTWTIDFSGNVYCDYVECLKMLEYGDTSNAAFYAEFYRIVRRGEVFKDESHDWLDDFKGYIVNNVVDILIKYIQKSDRDKDTDFVIKLSERILMADPVNEDALKYKIRALVKQDNYKLARFTYDKFSATYLEMYGEKFSSPFEKIVEPNSDKTRNK
ncbi:MAG TPA: LamG-like jellyroll fold domain-containing protein [Bacteroidales bacterium]|nr:LamG-like jellyroll fold domain-containing protein [Bacteroidales bacterium]